MKFLVDAQLPLRLARQISAAGHVIHTSELPDGNRTTDAKVAEAADADERVVITKDREFRNSHLLRSTPRHLLIVGEVAVWPAGLPRSARLARTACVASQAA